MGCRLNILAPEFLLNQEVASILNKVKQLDLAFLNVKKYDFSNFNQVVSQWQNELRQIKSSKNIPGNKLSLSQLLYKTKGNISATEVSNQIFWANRQINRYLNRYLGVSLKSYLNIQKIYEANNDVVGGNFFPEQDYFDQAHFIREL